MDPVKTAVRSSDASTWGQRSSLRTCECLRRSAVDVMVRDGLHAGWPRAEELASQHRPRPDVLRNVLMTCGLAPKMNTCPV